MRGRDALMWFGLLGAPLAWIAQHIAGVALTIGQCHDNAAGPAWKVHVDLWAVVATSLAAGVGVLALLAAFAAWRGVRDAEDDDAPPAGRIHFMAVIGLAISPLFLAITLMSGIGTLLLEKCVQS